MHCMCTFRTRFLCTIIPTHAFQERAWKRADILCRLCRIKYLLSRHSRFLKSQARNAIATERVVNLARALTHTDFEVLKS